MTNTPQPPIVLVYDRDQWFHTLRGYGQGVVNVPLPDPDELARRLARHQQQAVGSC